MIYYILILALGALCWAMWSYTAHREIKTLRNDLLASQVALGKAVKENKAKGTRNTTLTNKKHVKDAVLLSCIAASRQLMWYVREKAFFSDVDTAKKDLEKFSQVFDGLENK